MPEPLQGSSLDNSLCEQNSVISLSAGWIEPHNELPIGDIKSFATGCIHPLNLHSFRKYIRSKVQLAAGEVQTTAQVI